MHEARLIFSLCRRIASGTFINHCPKVSEPHFSDSLLDLALSPDSRRAWYEHVPCSFSIFEDHGPSNRVLLRV